LAKRQPGSKGDVATGAAGRNPAARASGGHGRIEGADPEFAVFVCVAAAAGSRRGEMGALGWPAVDLDAGELVISKGLIESKTGAIYEKDTKTHQARRIALDAGRYGARSTLCG